ncbi:MAG: helix-turn-helix domain-containing protein [Clostridia bacterium]|nr:helix-turn-helix domain-containing protein [Clostridia bacterium]
MFFNVKKLAEYLGCSESAIRKLVREKKIKFFRIGSKITFNIDDVNEYILEQKNIAQNNE